LYFFALWKVALGTAYWAELTVISSILLVLSLMVLYVVRAINDEPLRKFCDWICGVAQCLGTTPEWVAKKDIPGCQEKVEYMLGQKGSEVARLETDHRGCRVGIEEVHRARRELRSMHTSFVQRGFFPDGAWVDYVPVGDEQRDE
jgi:hypothetical protein